MMCLPCLSYVSEEPGIHNAERCAASRAGWNHIVKHLGESAALTDMAVLFHPSWFSA